MKFLNATKFYITRTEKFILHKFFKFSIVKNHLLTIFPLPRYLSRKFEIHPPLMGKFRVNGIQFSGRISGVTTVAT